MAQDASSSSDWPNYHATLTDGTTVIPIVFTDGQGVEDIKAFQINPYPRTALKTSEGDSKYSDLEPPYFAKAQDDFTGGRGNEDFENDTSRYYDGHHVDTNKESGVVLAGRETYSTGYRNADFNMPGSVTFQGAYSSNRFLAISFSASASYTTYACEIWVKKVGSPGDLIVALYDNIGSDPDSSLAAKTLTAANITADTLSVLTAFVWTGSPGITSGTTYWVVIDGGSGATATNHWAIGVDAATAGKKSETAAAWASTTYSPYYRITPAAAPFVGKFFEYKRGLYMVTQPDDGSNSALYINGDRGTADSNSGDKSNLEDATKSWTNDEWIGDVVLITKGPGSDETQNWRNITDNDSNTLVVSPDWNITHTTATEYVILGSDKWTSVVADLDYRVVDVDVAGEYIYFTPGADETTKRISRYRYYTSSGVWSTFNGTETSQPRADKLMAIRNSDGTHILYTSDNTHSYNFNQPTLTKNHVPEDGSNRVLFYDQGSILPSIPASWTGLHASNVTYSYGYGAMNFSLAGAHTTGVFGIHNFITPIDISTTERIRLLMMSSVTTGSTDMDFLIDDVEDLGKTWSPVKVFLADYSTSFPPTHVYHNDDPGSANTFTDLPQTYDGIASYGEQVTITGDDFLLIGADEKFDNIIFDLGTQKNVVADRTMTAFAFNGQGTRSVTITDGTKVADNGTFRTLAQDGTVAIVLPDDWVKSTLNDVEKYWILLAFSDALTAAIDVLKIYLTIDDATRIVPEFYDLQFIYDGDATTTEIKSIKTDDYIYVGYGTKFNIITVDMGATVNAVANTVMTGAYWNGSAWTSVTITDNTKVADNGTNHTLGKDGTITFTIPEDWEANTVNSTETYWVRLDVSINLTANIIINEITVTRQDNLSMSLPALTADTWAWAWVSPGAWATATPDRTSIASMGLELDTDKGAQDIYVKDVRLASLNHSPEQIIPMPASYRINGMEAYSGNADDPVENPWIFTEKGVYELQTQNDDQVVAIPLKELSTLQSSENGLGHTVNGTYLFFNIGEKIERYFNRTLDDVGPDRDEGLPDDRPGIPISMTSYPGRIYTVIDANTGTSSLLTMRGTAWSEVYRAPRSTNRIRSNYVQAIPGTNVDRLWFSMGTNILWVPISLNPYNETDFTYQHEGHLITSWIYAGMMDVEKLWKSLKVFAENVGANYNVVVDYQKDVETTWTEIGTFDTAPVEEIDIASTHPMGKRIRYRLRFISNDVSETPRLKAIVTEGMAFVPVKNQFSFTFTLAKGLDRIDTKGVHDDSRTPAQDWTTLKGWANDGQELTFTTQVPMADSSTVIIDPMTLTPLQLVPKSDKERYVCQLTAREI